MLGMQGQPARADSFPFSSFLPGGRGFGSALTGQYADVAQSEERRARRYVVGSSPTVCTIGVTSCLAAAWSVSLRKWSFLCAVRKRKDDGIYLLAGTGLVKMNGCDRRTGAGLKSSVVGLGTTVLERNPRRGCGVVAVVLGQSRYVGKYGCVVAPDRLCKTTGDALADRCKGCVPNSLLT